MSPETTPDTTTEKHGQGVRALIEARQHELEQSLSEIRKDSGGGKGDDIEAALSALKTMLPANLDQINPVTAQELTQWLETHKYIGQSQSTHGAHPSNGSVKWEVFANANIKFAVPIEWERGEQENRAVVVRSKATGIVIELVAVDNAAEAGPEEKILMAELNKILTDAQVTHPLKAIQQHGLTGQALGGSALKGGRPVEWFSLYLRDASGKGVLAVGYGDPNQPAAQKKALTEILDTIQPADAQA